MDRATNHMILSNVKIKISRNIYQRSKWTGIKFQIIFRTQSFKILKNFLAKTKILWSLRFLSAKIILNQLKKMKKKLHPKLTLNLRMKMKMIQMKYCCYPSSLSELPTLKKLEISWQSISQIITIRKLKMKVRSQLWHLWKCHSKRWL
jgi:hypothetical protein